MSRNLRRPGLAVLQEIIHISPVVWGVFASVKSGHQRNINFVTRRTLLKNKQIASKYVFAERWLRSVTPLLRDVTWACCGGVVTRMY